MQRYDLLGTRLRYRLTLASGILECLCFAGVVFGYASLVFVLKKDGYFSQLCVSIPVTNSTLTSADCSKQDEQFSLVFTIASFLNNFLNLVNGYVFDRFGTMVTRLLGIKSRLNKKQKQAKVKKMLNRLANNDPGLVSQYTNAFAMTQLCGILCAPLNGLIMDRHKGKPLAPGETAQEADLHSSSLSLFLTSLQCLLFSVCASIPLLPLQYLTFALQVLNRSFLYGGNAAFISIAFPACHFGKLYGLVTSMSALFSLLQYPCFTLVKGALGGDPFFVDIALIFVSLLGFIHPVYIFIHCRTVARDQQNNALDIANGSKTAEVKL
ncbi:solute carrier family 43 member 3a [Cyclopterus lumpus]|uniref:solute carrier family 43 member 3a n=1 Tax=Cyclopterus lumpus TaxID=8103 RepID=UPI0014862863|nr:solute carrier family 43 member 3a [Cyclopterus lumpus]